MAHAHDGFTDLSEALDDFIHLEHAYQTLVITSRDDDVPFVLKFLQSFDAASQSALYLVFNAPFKSPASFVDSAVDSVGLQLEAVNAQLAAQNKSELPPLPLPLQAPGTPPSERLRMLIAFGKTLVDAAGGDEVVWGFVPRRIDDRLAYSELLDPLLASAREPWMHGHRFIVRDSAEDKVVTQIAFERQLETVLIFDAALSTPNLLSDLMARAADRSVAVEERMTALFQLAAVDFAYQRLPAARGKYALLFEYFGSIDKPVMQTLCLSGDGDIAMRQQDYDLARERYQQGLALVAPQQSHLDVVQSLLIKVGDAHSALANHAEAAANYALARTVCGKTINVSGRSEAAEKLGLAQRADGHLAEAVATWESARQLCDTFELRSRQASVLAHLIAGYDRLGLLDNKRERQREKTRLEAPTS